MDWQPTITIRYGGLLGSLLLIVSGNTKTRRAGDTREQVGHG